MKKSFCILLSVVLIFSVFSIHTYAQNLFENATFLTKNYYVINGGTGDGRSENNPAASVYDVITSINNDGLTKDDVANIYIMQRSDWNTIPEGKIGKINGTLTTQPHNMTAWSRNGSQIPAHTATIVIKKHSSEVTYLAFTNNLGQNSNLYLNGPTVFEDIKIVCMRKQLRQIVANGNDSTFSSSTTYGYINNDEYATSPSVWNGNVYTSNGLDLSLSTANGKSNTYNNGFTNTIKGNVGNLRIATVGYSIDTFNEDYNVIVSSSFANFPIIWGNTDSLTSVTFNKNVNINIMNANIISHTAGATPVKVKGGIQAIYSKNTSVPTSLSEVSTISASNGIWEIVNNSEDYTAFSFTETAGTFVIKPGLVAIAKNKITGETFVSTNNILTIPSGYYEADVFENFVSIDDELRVYNNVTIDLATVKHEEKANMLFVGWIDSKTGNPAKQVNLYEYGDVLKAQYIPYNNKTDFLIEEMQIRTSDKSLRYIFTQNKNFTSKLPEIIEYGALTLPTDVANGGEFFVDKAFVKSWKWDEETKTIFTPSSYGTKAVKIISNNILEESTDYLKYTLCLTNIEQSKTRTFYGARGYITYSDLNGINHTVYTEQRQSSLYKAAAQETQKTAIHNSIIRYSDVDLTNAYWASNPITQYVSGVAGTTLSDPKYLLYNQAGLRVAEYNINTDIEGTEKTEICFFADPHLNYTSEIDIARGNPTLLANYRIRTWLANGAAGNMAVRTMNFAANFKKMVCGGDAVDYFSDGCMKMTYRMIIERSVNGSLKKVAGNHLTMETGGNALDIPFSNKWTYEEKMSVAQEYWPNNIYYDSEIMKKSSGDNNVMLIYMDGNSRFWECQIDPLTKDLTYARNNNIPVLIFMHIPMITHNPEDRNVYVNGSYGGGYYGTPAVNTGTLNFCENSRFMGDSSSNSTTKKVCNIIRSHSDIVKGVVNGDRHVWTLTNIVGIDENGNPNGTYIPQYNVYGSHYGGVAKIIIQ